MIKDDILNEFSRYFGNDLANELLSEYIQLKEAELYKKHDYVCQIAGRYLETVLKILLKLKKGLNPSQQGLKFENGIQELLNEKKQTVEDEILTLLLPLVMKAGYNIRNKKRVSHARGINPDLMDSSFICSLSDWIMGELLRLYHSKDDKATEEIIKKIFVTKIPIIQDINGDKILLDKNLSASMASLLMIYENGGSLEINQVEKLLLKYYTKNNIRVSISNNINDRKIHKDSNDFLYLTEKGYASLEDIFC